jgi:predicted CxxxxCH...CXXCH cytochrome family protein
MQGQAAAQDCVQCHSKPTDVLSGGRLFVGDATPDAVEVVFAGGLSAAGSYEGAVSCSNLYCHGTGLVPSATIQDTNPVQGCGDCHEQEHRAQSWTK